MSTLAQPTVSVRARTAARELFSLDRAAKDAALDGARCDALAAAGLEVAALDDPVGSVLRRQTLQNGLELTKLRVPLGVVLIVYEARPNVTVDAAVLCIKAGNACILRGSRLAEHTNQALLSVMRDALA